LKLDHDPGESAPAAHEGQIEEGEETEPALKRVNLTSPPFSPMRFPQPRVKRHRTLRIVAMILLIALIFALVRLIANLNPSDDQLLVRIGDQGTGIVDLRQGLPISPYLFGANVFPEFSTISVDQVNGFMDYTSPVTDGLRNAHINLLRFPGGGWGVELLIGENMLLAPAAARKA
jgi:hypothetical protein